jgi:uncharacterized RDD family membrane protein YckC
MGGQPGGGMPSWTNNITARGTIAGPGGAALADVPERIIAYIIDAIILGVIGYIVLAVLGNVLVETRTEVFLGVPIQVRGPSLIGQLVGVAIALAISAGYYIYMWSRMGGATIGMRLMKLRVADQATGGPITQNQAVTRWLFLGGPQALGLLYGALGVLGLLISLLVLGYYIYLLVTMAQSPTRQGLHDKQAKTVVAKAA